MGCCCSSKLQFVFHCRSLTHFITHTFFSEENDSRIVVALFDYEARERIDVSFEKGDRMRVINDTESDWWTVKVSHFEIFFVKMIKIIFKKLFSI